MPQDTEITGFKVIVRAEVRRDNEILIVKRGNKGMRPGEWEYAGGKIDPGENLEQALKREIKEELSFDIIDCEYFASYSKNQAKIISVLFLAQVEDDSRVELSEEHSDFAWVSLKNIDTFDLTTEFREFILNRLNKKNNAVIKTTESSTSLRIYTDGGSRGNPGPSATGFVIYDTSGAELSRGGTYLGVTTNNQAEYQALLEAAKASQIYSPAKIEFFLDSQLVVNQMIGKYKIKNKDLWPVHQAIAETLKDMHVTYAYVPREKNKAADAMVNEVLDSRK